MIQAEESREFKFTEESPIKHTQAGEMPNPSMSSQMGRRLEADLPLLSDPSVLRNLGVFFGALAFGVGMGIYLFRRSR